MSEGSEDEVMREALEWTKQTRRKQHVELKDLKEEHFLELIDSKN